MKASVGQISKQALHAPQWSFSGKSTGMSLFKSITPKNNHEPNSFDTKFVCFPCQPKPANWARGFSNNGAVSTNTFKSKILS